MHRKLGIVTLLAVVVIAFAMASIVLAGQVGDRDTFSGGTNCVGSWTNTFPYAAIKLLRVGAVDSLTATNVITYVRITSDGLYTQAVGVVTCASGQGNQGTLTWNILKPGDILRSTGIDAATGSASNTFTGMVEFEVQQH